MRKMTYQMSEREFLEYILARVERWDNFGGGADNTLKANVQEWFAYNPKKPVTAKKPKSSRAGASA